MQKIMFNDKYGLTKAVLARRKTQTRRLIPKEFFSLQWDIREDTLVVENDYGEFIDIRNTKFCMLTNGELVAIAQNYKACGGLMEDGTPRWDLIAKVVGAKNGGWNNKMFVKPELMPHQIRITNVRIEHLQDISDNDCLAEGIEFDGKAQSFYCGMNISTNAKNWLGCTPREAYAALIDKINGKGTWVINPYVFVYEFKLVK